jgi:predicted  nucleic acid-binding Zn-ribbon protein
VSTEDRVLKLENAFTTLVELVRNMDERMDDSNARTASGETNLAALSQIVLEVETNLVALSQIVLELAQSQKRSDERLDKFTERVDRLADTVEKFINESRDG